LTSSKGCISVARNQVVIYAGCHNIRWAAT
jgi:hypothetical protein